MSEYIIGISAEVIERAKNSEKVLVTPNLTEVVRCRNCKFFAPELYEHISCEYLMRYVEPSEFCCWGVRKDD